jgi:hypothetical protein
MMPQTGWYGFGLKKAIGRQLTLYRKDDRTVFIEMESDYVFGSFVESSGRTDPVA